VCFIQVIDCLLPLFCRRSVHIAYSQERCVVAEKGRSEKHVVAVVVGRPEVIRIWLAPE
jgi:hypothetical protein